MLNLCAERKKDLNHEEHKENNGFLKYYLRALRALRALRGLNLFFVPI